MSDPTPSTAARSSDAEGAKAQDDAAGQAKVELARPKDGAELPASELRHFGFTRQVRVFFGALRHSPVGKTLLILFVSMIAVILLNAYGQVRLNGWNKPFYDALSRRDIPEFLRQLGVFAIIAFCLTVLDVTQRWIGEMLKVRLREALVRDLVGHWMQPRRAFWLSTSGPMGVNPDQRMTEDAQKLCDLTSDLGIGLMRASILVASFAGVLWAISRDFSFRLGGQDYTLPGFMLWAAIAYAGFGSMLSYFVGRSLIGRNAERYAREADLRVSLVRINENLDGVSLAGGEDDERRRVERYLQNVLTAVRRLVRGWTNLTWVTAGFGWTTNVAPILIASPLYLGGKISFGGLMMAAAAFTQAQSSLRWFVDNFSTIADWRATLLRVTGFRQALLAPDAERAFDSRIDYTPAEAGRFAIERLQVLSGAGRDRLDGDADLRTGERLLILAAPGTGKTLLFRAIAGLWPWGSGRVSSPAEETVFYMPRGTPYLPNGTLREVLAYPAKTDAFDAAAYERALGRLTLERLAPLLDEERRWDRELSHDEQMYLAFARLLLRAPRWVLMEEAFAALDDLALPRIVDVFEHDLRETGVIHIGRVGARAEALFSQRLNLVRQAGDDDGAAPTTLAGPGPDPAAPGPGAAPTSGEPDPKTPR